MGLVGSSSSDPSSSLCLRAPGRFRVLEPAACDPMDDMQRWSYHTSGRFRLLGEPTLCLRFFEEAADFAAWSCEPARADLLFHHQADADAGPLEHSYCHVDKRSTGPLPCVVLAAI